MSFVIDPPACRLRRRDLVALFIGVSLRPLRQRGWAADDPSASCRCLSFFLLYPLWPRL